jgi:hypothetical protein
MELQPKFSEQQRAGNGVSFHWFEHQTQRELIQSEAEFDGGDRGMLLSFRNVVRTSLNC